MSGRNIAITGGTGYIGSRIAEYLLRNGYHVTILSRNYNQALPEDLRKSIKVVDYNNKGSLVAALKSIDCLIHLMSLNEIEAKEKPEEAAYVNVYLTEILLQAAMLADVRKIFYFSTAHVYGAPLSGVFDELCIPKPAHPYAVVHKAAEEFVMEKIITNKMEGVIFRLSNGFGYPLYKEVNRWTLLVNDICRQAVEKKNIIIKSKSQIRDFITITDVEQAVKWFLDRELSKDCIYNLSSGNTMSIGDMTDIVTESYINITGKTIPVICEDTSENRIVLKISNEKIIKTGFNMSNNFRDEIHLTLKKCFEWFN